MIFNVGHLGRARLEMFELIFRRLYCKFQFYCSIQCQNVLPVFCIQWRKVIFKPPSPKKPFFCIQPNPNHQFYFLLCLQMCQYPSMFGWCSHRSKYESTMWGWIYWNSKFDPSSLLQRHQGASSKMFWSQISRCWIQVMPFYKLFNCQGRSRNKLCFEDTF